MAFELRCKTPYGPFSSPEQLDIKAPPAVHTAQSRIAEWNREHHTNVAHHPHDARLATRSKVGAAQYEVQHCSACQPIFTAQSCPRLRSDDSCQWLFAGPSAGGFADQWDVECACKSAQPQAACMSCHSAQAVAQSWRLWAIAGEILCQIFVLLLLGLLMVKAYCIC